MTRTRRGIVDADNSWIIREELELDPASPTAPQDDFTIIATDFPIHSTGATVFNQIVIWGVGLISFGPITPAQTLFMTNIGTTPDLSGFPGDYVSFNYSGDQLQLLEYGVRDDGYIYISTSTGIVTITEDAIGIGGVTVAGSLFRIDFGGYTFTSTSTTQNPLYLSDLDVFPGTAAADVLTGNDQPETLLGLDGNDSLSGLGGGDRLDGGAGNDLIDGGTGNDRLFGGDGADDMFGGAGNDQLYGGAGNDRLAPGSGVDFVDGGDGIDQLSLDYSGSASALYFTYSPGDFVPVRGTSVSAANVESVRVQGTQSADVIIGTAFADDLLGGAGNDLLRGGAGDDRLDAGPATAPAYANLALSGDSITTAVPVDQFFALNANALIADATAVPHMSLTVPIQTDPFEFGQESHRYIAFTVPAGGGNLTVDVDGTAFGINTVVTLYDSSFGFVNSNDDGDYSGFDPGPFDPGSQQPADSLLLHNFTAGGTFYLEITSIVDQDNFTSSFTVHVSLDTAPVPAGNVLEGGTGNDTYVVNAASDAVVELAGEGNDTVHSSIDYVLGAELENLTLTGTAINGTGNALNNILTGNAANNVLSGGDGNDALNGGGGNDSLTGGNGVDVAYYATASAAVRVNLGVAGGQDTLGAGIDTLASIENAIGSAFNDTLTGNTLANSLNGLGGNDVFYGGAGNDSLAGGDGNDALDGGVGNDAVNGGNGTDVASYATAAAAVTVNLGLVAAQNTLGAGIDTLTAIENLSGSAFNDTLTGNTLANSLSGNGGNDILYGGGGNDSLVGGEGNDALEGGAGNDVVNGGNGIDIASYAAAAAAVAVNLGIAAGQNTLGAGIDTLIGIENLTGSGFNDTLTGSSLANVINGRAGNDTINGRGGNDALFGGSGQDSFRFDTPLNGVSNVDTLADFVAADDRILLSTAVFTGIAAGTLSAAAFQLGAAANDAGDRIIYDSATGRIFFDADGNGAGAQVLFARVAAGTALNNLDFVAQAPAAEAVKAAVQAIHAHPMAAVETAHWDYFLLA